MCQSSSIDIVTGQPRLTTLILDDQGELFQVRAVNIASGAGECERCGQTTTASLDITRLVTGTGVEGGVLLTRKDVGNGNWEDRQWGEEQHLGYDHPERSCPKESVRWWMYLCNGEVQWLSIHGTHLVASFLIRVHEAGR